MKVINIVTLLVVLGVCIYFIWKKRDFLLKLGKLSAEDYDNQVNHTVKPLRNKIAWVLTGYLFIVLRITGLTSIPGGVNQDGAMAAVDANALAHYLTDRRGIWLPSHLEGWGFSQMSSAMSYIMAPFIRIMGLNKLAMRLPILLLSCISAAAIVILIKKVCNEKAAFIAALFIAINPWHFMQSRWAIDCNYFPHFFILGFCLLIYGLDQVKYTYYAMIFFALCMYCYGVSFYMVPFFLIANAAMLLIKKKINWKQLGYCIGIYLGISWPIYLTMFINFMKWKTISLPFVTMQYFEGSIRADDILFFSKDFLKQLGDNLKSLLNVVFLQKDDLLWNTVPAFGTIYLCTVPFVILGIAALIIKLKKEQDSNKRIAVFMLLSFWAFSVLLGIFINNVNVNRINIVFYANILLAIVGIYIICKYAKECTYFIVAVFVLQSSLFFNTYFSTWAEEIQQVFFNDFLEAVDSAAQYETDYYIITPDTQYEGAWPVSEILVMYEMNVDAAYYQGVTNKWKDREIPYGERFRYTKMEDTMEPANNTIYVLRKDNISKFAENQYQIEIYGNYATVVPWEIVWKKWENVNEG